MSATLALGVLALLPAASGVVLLVAGRRADRLAGPAAIVVTGVGVLLAVAVAVARPEVSAPFLGVPGGELALAVDGLSAVMVATVAAVAAVVTVFAAVDVGRTAPRARFFGFWLLFIAAMLVTVTATTLPTLLIAWEVMGATSYALIGYGWQDAGRVSAGTTAFLTTRAGDLGLYVAAGAALAGTGSLSLDGLADARGGWLDVAAGGILLAALGKSAQLPFSAWLSAAMQGPSPVSALLHSATMVAAGGYLLLRTAPVLAETAWASTTAAWAGALTALVLGAVACAQSDLKQLLAASTAAQIGFVVLGAGVAATAGGTAQLVAHASVKAGLFVAAGAWLTSLGTKQLDGLRGAARRHRGVGGAAAVALLALAGVPPLSLWATKDEVLAGVDGAALRVVALGAAALSAAYAGKVLAVVFSAPAAPEQLDVEEPGTRVVPTAAVGAAVVLAAGAAGLGALALPAVAEPLKDLVGAGGEPSPGLAELLLSGALAIGVLTLVLTRPALVTVSERTVLSRWAGLGRLLSPRPAMAVARAAAWADDHLLDRAVMAVPRAVQRAAAGADRADQAVVDGAVRALAGQLLRAGAAARRPQTGLLHQYYVQAVAGLGVLLVLLLVVR